MSSIHKARMGALLACLGAASGVAAAEPDTVILHDVELVTDTTYIRGTDATVYLATTGARGLTESDPIADAQVELSLEPSGDAAKKRAPLSLASARTRRDGTAVVRFAVPRDLAVGAYTLLVRTRSPHGQGIERQAVRVIDATTLHVRTDRGVYRPGQKLRWRVTAVNSANAHPLADVQVDVSIADPGGTAIWSGRVATGTTGMASGDIALDNQLILGQYTVAARAGEVESSSSVKVRAYNLPAFVVTVDTDTQGPYAPGSEVRGHVVARYLHGEPVSGRVALASSGIALSRDSGQLDEHGRMAFTGKVAADGSASVRAHVTDGADRTERATLELPLEARALEIAVIPERPSLTPGVEQWLTILTTNGDGRFVPAELRVTHGGSVRTVSSSGAVRVPVTPAEKDRGHEVRVDVRARAGQLSAHHAAAIEIADEEPRFIRPRTAVVKGGAAFAVEGRWSGASGPLVVTLMRQGTPVASAVAQVDGKTGALTAYIQPPPGVFGLATVRATDAVWDRQTGAVEPVFEQATVYLEPTELDVSIHGATRYRPGQTASLDVEVRDRAGSPVAGAGLAASVVDERALLLAEPGPDLIAALRELDTGSAQAAGVAFARLLTEERSPRNIAAMRALIESLPPDSTLPKVHISAADRWRAELARMGEAREGVYKVLLTDHRPIGVRAAGGAWEFADSLDRLLARAGWDKARRLTPWRKTLDFGYARRLLPDFTFDEMAPRMAEERLEALAQSAIANSEAILRGVPLERLAAQGKMPRHAIVDPWGTPIRIVKERPLPRPADDPADDIDATNPDSYLAAISAGPDQMFGTKDDIIREDLLTIWGYGYGYGSGGGSLNGRHAGTVAMRAGMPSVNIQEVAVRKNFDQTVLWQTGIQTDARGRYTLEVPLADSITGWRVDVLALGPKGAVGAARSHIETAMPEYMEATMPYALTVGDSYELPVVVANHGGTTRTLEVRAMVSGSLELADQALARAPKRVSLPSGTTAMVAVGVRARGIGKGVVDLTLSEPGGQVLDRTQHALEVEAPGRLERSVHLAEGQEDRLRVPFSLPADHTPGSERATLRLYRGVVDQALDGLDGLLSEPHGCFEQTSSTTYPNLLVLRLLGEKEDDVRERARELVGKGYQRLISYEVSGGGFSWFGEAPANQVLTAYGLMEFVDMSAVYPVDANLIERTRTWLLEQQKPDGSWTRDESWLHDWSAVQGKVSTTAYIAWALAESGYRGKELDKALAFLRNHSTDLTGNPYLLALWSAAEAAAGKADNRALAALLPKVERDGDGRYISAGGETLFYTSGKGADVQVTALGAVAMARADSRARARNQADIKGSLDWLWSARDARSGWGTTQGTVLALRAYAFASRGTPAGGRVTVRLDGRAIGEIDLDDDNLPILDLSAAMAKDPAASHELSIEPANDHTDVSALRADVRASWRTGPAKSAVAAGMSVTLDGGGSAVRVGQEIGMSAQLANQSGDVIAMPTVIIPVPPGFQAVQSSLDELQRLDAVSRAEDQGSEIHVYLSHLDKGARIELPYRLEATAACDVTQRSAQAYAYYNPETRGVSTELRLRALPRR